MPRRPTPKDPWPEELVAPESAKLTQEEKLHDWRLLSLIDAYRTQKEPLDIVDVSELGKIAAGTEDLHAACGALRSGCKLKTAVKLFT